MAVEKWKQAARKLKTEIFVLYLAFKHPHTPWLVKLLAGVVVAYAFSPIDLVPDFIPILGYLDDLILIPIGIAFVIKLIPTAVLEECRKQAQIQVWEEKPVNWGMALLIMMGWLCLAAFPLLKLAEFLG